MAALEQGKFWEYHDLLFENHPKIQRSFLLQYAKDLGLDVARFEKAIDSDIGKQTISADAAEAQKLGATCTPAFFVNGRYLSGAKPFQAFADVINAELTRKKLPIPAGAKAAGG